MLKVPEDAVIKNQAGDCFDFNGNVKEFCTYIKR